MKKICGVIALTLSSAVHAQTNADLKQKLDQTQMQLEQALKVIRDLQTRMNTLERKDATTLKETAVRPSSEAGAPVVAPTTKPASGIAEADKARLEVSGHIMLDAIYDAKSVDPDWSSTLRPSKIPVYCSDSGGLRDTGCGKDGDTNFSVRQTKLAIKGFIPTELGELRTIFDVDLFDVGSGNSNTHMRVQNAWAELGAFGAGQYDTLFMDGDIFPNTIDYWGPSGMVFVRNPQLRYTPYRTDSLRVAFSLEAPGSALDTGKVGLIDPALGSGISSRQEIPDFIANVRHDGDWGHVQVAAIYRKLSFETPSNPNSEPEGSEDGYGVNLTGQLNTFGDDRIVAQFAIGDGIASYMNDGGSDVAPAGPLLVNPRAEAVQSVGWLLYYDHYWNEKWSSSIGYSEHKQDTTSGQLFNAFEKGSYASLNLLYMPVANVTTGAELLWGQRENKDGKTGEDSRVQFSSKFAF